MACYTEVENELLECTRLVEDLEDFELKLRRSVADIQRLILLQRQICVVECVVFIEILTHHLREIESRCISGEWSMSAKLINLHTQCLQLFDSGAPEKATCLFELGAFLSLVSTAFLHMRTLP